MLIAARESFAVASRKRLPYDAEVQYLEFTGAQFIDSGVAVANPATIEVGVDSTIPAPYGFTHQSVVEGTWVSAYYAASASVYIVNYKNYSNRYTSYNEPTTRALRVFDGDSGMYRDGVLQWAFAASVGSDSISNRPWPIGCVWDFAANNYDFRYAANGMRMYGAYLKVGDVIVRDMIPVRFTNEQNQSEGAMYDRVSGQLFRNVGTGSFTLGPDVS